MNKILTGLTALTLVLGLGTGTAAFADKKDDAIAKACKDKKPGDTVKVDGKEVKCPEPKTK